MTKKNMLVFYYLTEAIVKAITRTAMNAEGYRQSLDRARNLIEDGNE